jgi:hypothetical protein
MAKKKKALAKTKTVAARKETKKKNKPEHKATMYNVYLRVGGEWRAVTSLEDDPFKKKSPLAMTYKWAKIYAEVCTPYERIVQEQDEPRPKSTTRGWGGPPSMEEVKEIDAKIMEYSSEPAVTEWLSKKRQQVLEEIKEWEEEQDWVSS